MTTIYEKIEAADINTLRKIWSDLCLVASIEIQNAIAARADVLGFEVCKTYDEVWSDPIDCLEWTYRANSDIDFCRIMDKVLAEDRIFMMLSDDEETVTTWLYSKANEMIHTGRMRWEYAESLPEWVIDDFELRQAFAEREEGIKDFHINSQLLAWKELY